jgi:hypothetical protein
MCSSFPGDCSQHENHVSALLNIMIAKWNNKLRKTQTFNAHSIKHLIHLAASSELLAPNWKTLVKQKQREYTTITNKANEY